MTYGRTCVTMFDMTPTLAAWLRHFIALVLSASIPRGSDLEKLALRQQLLTLHCLTSPLRADITQRGLPQVAKIGVHFTETARALDKT